MALATQMKIRFAKTAFCLMLLLAWGIGGYRHIADMNASVAKAFDSVEQLLIKRVTAATNLATVASRHLSDEDDALTALRVASQNLAEQRANPTHACRENAVLSEAVVLLASTLNDNASLAGNSADTKYVREQIAQLNSYDQSIKHTDYNKKAQDFNRYIESFPHSGIARLCSVQEAPLYQ